MFPNATVSSRSSSSRSANSCSRNSSMPSLRMRNPLSPKTSFNPLFRHSDALTSFDASNFVFQDYRREKKSKRHPILRRYNSHDSHATHQVDTPESTKSRTRSCATPEVSSADNTGERQQELGARDFLERYSLPRVVRVGGGEPLLLYRCFDSFTKVQARGIVGKKGKEKPDGNVLHFPEGYSGWFSLTNEKGEKCAVTYTSVLQLVREQVCSFISIQPFNAYAAHGPDSGDIPGKVQYLKTQVRGGQLFQLRAVFQHKDRPDGGKHSTRSSKIARSTRDKDLGNRYAQVISQTNQELYVPLTTKGEFYEIHSSIKARLCFPGLLDKTGPLALDKDCLYKLTHLLRRVALPLKVKLLAGPLPAGLPKDFTDTFLLERKFQEPLMVTCTLPPPTENTHRISCIRMNSGLKISKCTLGFDSENRLFKSQRLQAALSFCHKNVESWYREVRLAPNLEEAYNPAKAGEKSSNACKECDQANKACDGRCRVDNVEEDASDSDEKQIITKEVIDKFPKSKKWYKHFKILGPNSEATSKEKSQNPKENTEEKVKSIERYKDMSKLIEEKFGKKSYNPVKKSASFMFSTKRIDLEEEPSQKKSNPALLKCQSLDTQLQYYDASSRTPGSRKSDWNNSKSNISDISYDFRMCILENEKGPVDFRRKTSLRNQDSMIDMRSMNLQVTQIDWDEIKEAEDAPKLRKTKPDLIPTLPKDTNADNSYITERLCSEFHVKTKVQRKSITKQNLLTSNDKIRNSGRQQQTALSIFEEKPAKQAEEVKKPSSAYTKSVVVQVHEVKPSRKQSQGKKAINVDDIPYSHVVDEVCDKPSGRKTEDENIYAEICETVCNRCDTSKLCDCKRTKKGSDYYYVKLGSNGESVSQSDSDEAIYNTLR